MTAAQFTIEIDVDDLKWIIEHMTALSREQIVTVGEPYLRQGEADGDIIDLIRIIVQRAWTATGTDKLGPGKLPQLRAAIEEQLMGPVS